MSDILIKIQIVLERLFPLFFRLLILGCFPPLSPVLSGVFPFFFFVLFL